jgi:hypothetical protein
MSRAANLGDGKRAAESRSDGKVDLAALSRRQLQELAKRMGVKANQKSADIVAQLRELPLESECDGMLIKDVCGGGDGCGEPEADGPPRQQAQDAWLATSSQDGREGKEEAADVVLSLSWQQLQGTLLEHGTDAAMEYLSACLAEGHATSSRSAPQLVDARPQRLHLSVSQTCLRLCVCCRQPAACRLRCGVCESAQRGCGCGWVACSRQR